MNEIVEFELPQAYSNDQPPEILEWEDKPQCEEEVCIPCKETKDEVKFLHPSSYGKASLEEIKLMIILKTRTLLQDKDYEALYTLLGNVTGWIEDVICQTEPNILYFDEEILPEELRNT